MALTHSTDNKKRGARPTQAGLAPVIDFLRRHAPFNRLAPAHIEFLVAHLKLAFYAKGEAITEPGRGPAETFFIIKQGRVRGEVDPGGEQAAWELHVGECFPIGALLSHRPVRFHHRAIEDSFCFELARENFETLGALSPEFRDFCSRRLANLLDQTQRVVQAHLAAEVSGEAALSAELSTLVRRAPVTCSPQTAIQQALEIMHSQHVGSIIVTDDQDRPLGVFTLHDLLKQSATSGLKHDAPIARVMTAPALALSPRQSAYEAALLMTREGFGHVCVTENGRLVGVVSERDLFSLQRIGLVNLSRSITRAPDLATLVRLGQDVHRLIDQMLVQGASVGQLMQIITLLNDYITVRVIELCLAETGMAGAPSFTWLSFGSEGRQEQTLKTDQDNGMLFVPPPGQTAEAVRAQLLPLARRINAALDQCGYPLCTGNIMAGNPECCLSIDEWKERFAAWIDQGTPEHLLNASIYFDFRPLYGDTQPAEELKRWVAEQARDNPRFLKQLAENALRNEPPLGLMRDFVLISGGEHPHTLDLKLKGATPFVDGARLLALAKGITETNTFGRLRAAADVGVLSGPEAEAWCDAYGFIQLLRMRAHQEQERAGQTLNNYIDPDGLNELDRRILKEAFRQARKLQTHISLDYRI
jgi:CBS domain-containing protein